MTIKDDSDKVYNGIFQLTIDTDSIFISQSPDNKKSRVTLTNLRAEQLEQIITGLYNADLENEVIEGLKKRRKS